MKIGIVSSAIISERCEHRPRLALNASSYLAPSTRLKGDIERLEKARATIATTLDNKHTELARRTALEQADIAAGRLVVL